MGGFGSTRWGWQRNRATTDPYLRLDVRILARRGARAPGAWAKTAWTLWGEPSGEIAHLAEADALILDYKTCGPQDADWRSVRYRIPLDHTPCHYGGTRPWFLCPCCGRRRAVLHNVGGHNRCRTCHDLTYPSTRETPSDRAFRRAETLRRKIGAKPGLHQWAPKPKGMHWDTYERIVREISAADHDTLALFVEAREKLWGEIMRSGMGNAGRRAAIIHRLAGTKNRRHTAKTDSAPDPANERKQDISRYIRAPTIPQGRWLP